MKTIKVFLASSDELEIDRYKFGDLVLRLNGIYKKRGIEIELVKWENLDASYQGRRTQDMYNDIISECNMFAAVFHKIAGKFTIEEFDVARECFDKNSFPKVYTYMKDLSEGESETAELAEFKDKLYNELGHYWCKYGNNDTMQLHFVLQLQLLESENKLELEVKDSKVLLDNHPVANLDNVPFAACNDQYIDLKQRLETINRRISRIEAKPESELDQSDKDDLDDYKSGRIDVNKKLDELEKALLATAINIAKSQGKASSERLRKANELFASGDYKGADAKLDPDEIEADIKNNRSRLSLGKKLVEAAKDGYRNSIEEYKQKADYALLKIDDENRFDEADSYYNRTIELAKESELPKDEYADLMDDYIHFASKYARYDKTMELCLEHIELCKELYGVESAELGSTYNMMGIIYREQGEYTKALECYSKTLTIVKNIYGDEYNTDTASCFSNIGHTYCELGDYTKALDFHLKSIAILKKNLGEENLDIADCYNNIGMTYYNKCNYSEALKYYSKALSIRESILGYEHYATATCYNNIGMTYKCMGDKSNKSSYYKKALKCYNKSLPVITKIFGEKHPYAGFSYDNLGLLYASMGNPDKALEYLFKSLRIIEKKFGYTSSHIATCYNNIGQVYIIKGDYNQAAIYISKALTIFRKTLGDDHPNTKLVQNSINDIIINSHK